MLAAWACLFYALGFALCVAPAHAFEAPPLRGHVNDTANMLSADTQVRLEQRLASFQAETGPQFALLTVEHLEGLSVEQYSMHVVEAWKLGSAEKDDGLLLLIAKHERKMRIEVGHGLEGAIPDLIASRIIREILTPAFKQDDYDKGIEAALAELIVRSGGQAMASSLRKVAVSRSYAAKVTQSTSQQLVFGLAIAATFMPFLLVFALVLRLKRNSGGRVYGSTATSSGSRSSSSSRASSSSSISGGGGSFGGGGASGSW